jgi:AhpD family alkylhydroperoxidase
LSAIHKSTRQPFARSMAGRWPSSSRPAPSANAAIGEAAEKFEAIAANQAARRAKGVHGYIAESGLPSSLVNLVYLRVSQINGCAYCIDMHSRDLIKEGFAIEKLVLVQAWREAGGLFDARERAALAWAETVTRVADTAVPDNEFVAASAVFSEKELADLTIAIGLMNAYNRLAIGFRNTPSAVRDIDAARCGEKE